MIVELVYEKSCPNIKAARSSLLQAFASAGIAPHWQEWEVTSVDAPAYIHGYGSPTILVNGSDVSANQIPGHDLCCRVYKHDSGLKGTPDVAEIVAALKANKMAGNTAKSSWQVKFSVFPIIVTALLPKLACAACWPAYAGLLSSFGIGFFDYTPYLLPFTIVFLLIVIVSLFFRAQQRRGYGPLILGLLAAVIFFIAKFIVENAIAVFIGISLLVMASVWNSWPKRKSLNKKCGVCQPSVHE